MSDNTELIRKAREWAAGFDRSKGAERQNSAYYIKALADELEAAKPRQVTTVEELKALKLPAIIDSPAGGPSRVEYYAGPGRQQRYVEPLFSDDDSDTECYSPEFFATFGLPATVLYSPVVAP